MPRERSIHARVQTVMVFSGETFWNTRVACLSQLLCLAVCFDLGVIPRKVRQTMLCTQRFSGQPPGPCRVPIAALKVSKIRGRDFSPVSSTWAHDDNHGLPQRCCCSVDTFCRGGLALQKPACKSDCRGS